MPHKKMTLKEMAAVKHAILQETRRKPPTFAMTGVSGAGKSSVINRLFKTSLPVSHVRACTKEFISTDIGLQMNGGVASGTQVNLRVIDCPGNGEDIALESKYLDHYRQHLPEADVILHVSAARNRAVALEQQHLMALKEHSNRMVFGLSQIDLVVPGNWNDRLNQPGKEQLAHIAEICEDRSARFSAVLDREVSFIPFSAQHGYGLQSLFTALIMACPKERAFLFDGLKGFSFQDFIPAAALKQLGSEILQSNPQ